MSKAIFIMEMPKRCSECRFCLQVKQKNGLALCLAIDDNKPTEYNPKRESEWLPDWCPLKPMPEHKEENHTYEYEDIKNEGFNACLDMMLDT